MGEVEPLERSPLMHANWLLAEGLLLCSQARQIDEAEKERIDRNGRVGRSTSMTPYLIVSEMYDRKLREWEERVVTHLRDAGFDPYKAR